MSGGDNVYINFISSTLNKPYHVSFTSFITLKCQILRGLNKLHTNPIATNFRSYVGIFDTHRVHLMIKDYPSLSKEKMCVKNTSLNILVHPFNSKTCTKYSDSIARPNGRH